MAGGPHANLHMIFAERGQSELVKESGDPPDIRGLHPQKPCHGQHRFFRKISKLFLNLKQDGDEAVSLSSMFLENMGELFFFLVHFFNVFTYSGRKVPIPAASLGPITTSQPGNASSNSPLILATLPGSMIFLFFTLLSIPDFLTMAPT